jgi:DNA-binding response OmpR family regulator
MAPPTVLLIDSDQDSLTIYSLILRYYGYAVVTVQDGANALRIAEEVDPDIVISELFLPRAPGHGILRELRENDRTARKPLIVLDSVPMLGDTLMEGLTGTSRLTKPCTPTRLVEEVAKLLKAANA